MRRSCRSARTARGQWAGSIWVGVGNLEDQIITPNPGPFDLPTWLQTKPGNMNNVDAAMNTYDGQIILIPMFDGTCKDKPTGLALTDCTAGAGVGNNTWYHIRSSPHSYLTMPTSKATTTLNATRLRALRLSAGRGRRRASRDGSSSTSPKVRSYLAEAAHRTRRRWEFS